MTTFKSIFSSNENVDQSLNKIFTKKIVKKEKNPIVEGDSETTSKSKDEEEIVQDTKRKFGSKRDPEIENRTCFVGNLHVGCKKEVNKIG